MKHEAFTLSGDGYLNKLVVPVIVTNQSGESGEFPALVDTGATNTCVSQELAEQLHLIPIGTSENLTANGRATVNIYVVDLLLCGGRVHIQKNRVLGINLTEQVGVEMLIGMDILRHGDFAISNYQGKTKASFRVPSIRETDFVIEVTNHNKFEEEKLKRQQNAKFSNGKKKKRR